MKRLLIALLAAMFVLISGCKMELETTVIHKSGDPVEMGLGDIVFPDGSLYIADFDSSTMQKFLEATTEVKDYRIILNTGGGHAFNMVAMMNRIEHLQAQGAHITTEVYGYALSAGTMLFLLGDDRIIHDGAVLMFHCVGISSYGERYNQKTMRSKDEWAAMQMMEMLDANIEKLLREKFEWTDKQIENWLFFEKANFMSSEEAYELGIANIYQN